MALRKHTLLCVILAVLALTGCGPTPEQRRDAVQSLLAEGDRSGAIFELKSLLQTAPEDRDARRLLAELSLAEGEFQTAASEFERALDLGEDSSQAILGYAKTLLYLGDFDAAKGFARDKLATGAFGPEGTTLYADTLTATGEREQAATEYRKAIAADETFVPAYIGLASLEASAGLFGNASVTVDKALQQDAQSATAWLLKARLAAQTGNSGQALTAYANAGRYESADAPLIERFNRKLSEAQYFLGENDPEPARASVGKFTDAFPAAAVGLLLNGQLFLLEGKIDEAKDALQEYNRVVPDDTDGQIFLGVVNFEQSNFRQAEMFLSRAVSAAENQQLVRRLLAQTQLSLDKPAEAFLILQPLMDEESNDGGLLAMLGQASIQAGNREEGVRYFDESLATAPNEPALILSSAAGYLAAGQPDKAIALLQQNEQVGQEGYQRASLLILANIRAGDNAAAVATADRLLADNSDDSSAYALAGSVRMMVGLTDEAEQQFQQALRLDPSNLGARLNLGRLKQLRGDVTGAEQEFRRVLDSRPAAVSPLLSYMELLDKAGRKNEVTAAIETAIKADSESLQLRQVATRWYLQSGDFQSVRTTAESGLEQFPDDAELQGLLGVARISLGETQVGLRQLERARELEPDSLTLNRLLADYKARNGDVAGAISVLQSYVSRNPGDGEAAGMLSELLIRSGDVGAAESLLAKQREATGETASTLAIQGDIRMQGGQFEEAYQFYSRAYELSPVAPLMRRKYQAAVRAKAENPQGILQQWLGGNPTDNAVRSQLGDFYQAREDYDSAAEQYRVALESEPDSPVLLNNLAWSYAQAGNPDALGYAEQANQLAPGVAGISDTLGWILVSQGEITRGRKFLEEAAEGAPGDPNIQYHLAYALSEDGAGTQALSILQKLPLSSPAFLYGDEANALIKRLQNN